MRDASLNGYLNLNPRFPIKRRILFLQNVSYIEALQNMHKSKYFSARGFVLDN